MKAFTVVPSRSGVLRPEAEREVLNLFGARMAAVSLSGYIFFGSSLTISDQVHCPCWFYRVPPRGPPSPPLLRLPASVPPLLLPHLWPSEVRTSSFLSFSNQ